MASTFRASDWTQSTHTNGPQTPLPGFFYYENLCVKCFAEGHTENEMWNSKYSQGVCIQVLIMPLQELLPQGAR